MPKNINSKGKILFICHESSRTGAPIFLLNLIRWFCKNTAQEFLIVIDKGGELESDFRELGKTYIIRPLGMTLFGKLWFKYGYSSYLACVLKSIGPENIALIYSNTIANGKLSSWLKDRLDAFVVTHVHEMESVIHSLGHENLMLVKNITGRFIAASESVRENLQDTHGIPGSHISVIHECIDTGTDLLYRPAKVTVPGIKPEDFIIGNAGFVDYRKGFDLFLKAASSLIHEQELENVKFIWIGAFGRGREREVRSYIRTHKLESNVFFLGEVPDPIPYYMIFDILFLTSREDPFPLVMLENAFLGKPVIGFKGTGGVEEFTIGIEELLAEPFDIGDAAHRIVKLKEDPQKRKELGDILRRRVKEKYSMEKNGMAINEYILRLMN